MHPTDPLDLDRAADCLRNASAVAVLTGAGVSAESGVPTFRGAGGLWEGQRVEDVATPSAFARDPALVWRFYNARRAGLRTIRPNPGHDALVALEEHFGPDRFTLITQNVDGLHRAAGSRRVLELHGNLARVRCTGCEHVADRGGETLADLPRCDSCGQLLRPDIVWFHEMLPQNVWMEAEAAVMRCQCFLVVGTSAVVYPAAGLIELAHHAGARVVEVNLTASAAGHLVDVGLYGPSGAILPQVVERLREVRMTARLLDGKQLAQTMQAETAERVAALVRDKGVRPGLAAVLVGDNPASQVYVRNKRKACEKAGIASWLHELPKQTTQAELLALLGQLNADPQVHGILVQLPLPPQIDEAAVIRAVSPAKDVDGFGPESLGLLAAGHPRFLPCTPHGVKQLLLRNGVSVDGAHVVIVGRSNIVGKPLALILMQKAAGANATVTVCHSRSRTLAEPTRQADVVVVAIGQAAFFKADMVRPGAVVVDVGINRTAEGKVVGDVDFEPVSRVASAITPVPGGVGPMTITMLLHNTVQAAMVGPC